MIATQHKLMQLFDSAVKAALPQHCLAPHLPAPPTGGRLIILAAGKGTSAMVRAAEAHYLDASPPVPIEGIGVTRNGFALPTRVIPLIEAGHPVPDANSVRAAKAVLELASGAGEKDTVLVLLSGGASALWTAPVEGVTLEEKQAVTRGLLKSGAPIGEINCVRRHLSRIKGGRLALAASPARVITLAISDVPRDEPAAIGSGPTVGDPTTLADARAILRNRRVSVPASVTAALSREENETPDPASNIFARTNFALIARPAGSLEAAACTARDMGYAVRLLGDSLEGEARDVARDHAALAIEALKRGERLALLSGGELTVTIRGEGRGGPNQEYALAVALAIAGQKGISGLAADTDGTDGGSGAADDPAGALFDASTVERAAPLRLEPAKFLENNDSTGFFEKLGDLIICGPTHTNVNDFRAILVDP
ncbi:MAG: glycerate kinase [Pseudomonadota bacterium]|nr:glycerate kinase [Pseudomonadota bacterium]